MINRLGVAPAVLAVGLAAVATLSACERYEANEAAATVNGHELSLDQLEELAEGNDDPTIQRAALSAWIQVVAASEDPGELLTEADLAAQREVVLAPLVEALQEQTQSEYEQGLQGSVSLCMAVIPLAEDVPSAVMLDALEDGIPFAELAAQYSEDPGLAASGGIISAEGQECLPTDQWNAELLELLADADAVVGEPGVIILNNSEVIFLLRPFAELTDGSKILLAQGPVSEALLELYRAAEVTVHESIGTWDAEQGMVVASSSHE